jgi:uncharacterized protein (DUF2249 family)
MPHAEHAELVVDTREASDSCVNLTNRALDELAAGASFLLISDHDPCGLRYMLEAERPGAVAWETVEDGPARWQARIVKVAQPG